MGENINRDQGDLMKLKTPFTILNRKFNEMDYIRHSMKSKEKSATERLHDDYRKMFKSDPCIMYCDKEPPTMRNGYVWSTCATDLPQKIHIKVRLDY